VCGHAKGRGGGSDGREVERFLLVVQEQGCCVLLVNTEEEVLEGWEAGYLLGSHAGGATKRVFWAFTLGLPAAVVHVATPRLVLEGLVSLVLLLFPGRLHPCALPLQDVSDTLSQADPVRGSSPQADRPSFAPVHQLGNLGNLSFSVHDW